jgi:hypothetical protein
MALLDPLRPAFRAIATTVVPEAAALDEPGWRELEGIVEQALAQRPPRLRRQLLLFIRAIELLPAVRGRRFSARTPAERARFLAALERAPLLLVRRGFWGLRTLILMGYYARPGAATAIGYRADPRGWDARR